MSQVMKQHWKICGVTGAALILGCIGSSALGTPGSGFNAVQQYKGVFAPMNVKAEASSWELELKTKGSTDLYVVRNSIDPGGTSGWHRHPGPSLITVTAGEITAYDSDDPSCAPTVYKVGQGFIDDGDHAHMLRNETSDPAETVAVQFLAPGTTARRIDAAEPSHC